MAQNRRQGLAEIPDHFDRLLSPEQEESLNMAELHGWKVKFVRRPTIVLVHENGETLGVLEEDGNLNLDANVRERGARIVAEEIPRGSSEDRLLI